MHPDQLYPPTPFLFSPPQPTPLITPQEEGRITVAGVELVGEELLLKKEFKGDTSIYQVLKCGWSVVGRFVCLFGRMI